MSTASFIIPICVIIPAVIAISVCSIIYYSRQNKNRQCQRQRRNSSDEYHHSHEQGPQDNQIIDFPRAYRYQQQRRLRESPPVLEQSPSLYDTYSINQTRRPQLPVFSLIRTTPLTTHVHRPSSVITPSVHAAMPPSYDEIFLNPHTLTNR